jgi:hypothetical protein
VKDLGEVLVAIVDASEHARVTAAAAEVDAPEFPADFDQTKKVLASMLRENTGASVLDSGGAYGRSWQRNLAKPFWEEPATALEVHVYDGHASFEVTHNVFHWLAERLTYDRGMTKRLRKLGEREDLYGMRLAERFPEWLAERDHEIGGIYGEGSPVTVNTYNGEDLLSQTLQYVFFRCDGEDYVALQIHGGADVRGGYTDPVIFMVNDELAIFDNAKAGIAPDWHALKALQAERDLQGTLFGGKTELNEINWSTDDGCHWYYQGSGRDYDAKQLDKLSAIEIADASQWKRGKVCVLPDHTALCPFTGVKLVASWY